jgi:hypothetical protein
MDLAGFLNIPGLSLPPLTAEPVWSAYYHEPFWRNPLYKELLASCFGLGSARRAEGLGLFLENMRTVATWLETRFVISFSVSLNLTHI